MRDETHPPDSDSDGISVETPGDGATVQQRQSETPQDVGGPQTQETAPAPTRAVLRRVRVTAGGWRTLEFFFNAQGTAFFRQPAGAKIKVRYGVGWFGFDRQEQTLDGENYKKLSVGWGSISRARMQMRVERDTNVTYEVHGGGVAVDFPEQEF